MIRSTPTTVPGCRARVARTALRRSPESLCSSPTVTGPRMRTCTFGTVPAAFPGLRRNRGAAPGFGFDVGQGLRERPAMPGEVLGLILALAEREVFRLRDDPRAGRPGAFAVGRGVLHPDHDRVRHARGRAGRRAFAALVGDDHRAPARA